MDKVYIVKVGDLYVTPDGDLSPAQADAVRVIVTTGEVPPRAVRLRSKSSDSTGFLDGDCPF
jgi:hypothetical protein